MAERNPAVWIEFRQDTGYIDDMTCRAARQLGDDKALRGDRDHLRALGRISARHLCYNERAKSTRKGIKMAKKSQSIEEFRRLTVGDERR